MNDSGGKNRGWCVRAWIWIPLGKEPGSEGAVKKWTTVSRFEMLAIPNCRIKIGIALKVCFFLFFFFFPRILL